MDRSPESKPSRGRGSWPPRLALFFRQVVAELRKVIWPTRSELLTYTIVVLVFVLIHDGDRRVAATSCFTKLILKVFGSA